MYVLILEKSDKLILLGWGYSPPILTCDEARHGQEVYYEKVRYPRSVAARLA
jgi:hypothetical protein